MSHIIENSNYWNQLTKDLGTYRTGDDKGKRFQSDFKFEELFIGMAVFNEEQKTVSKVTGLTSNSVETINFTNQKNRYKSGAVDADGETADVGKLKGLLQSKNWYTMDNFNRTFKRTSIEERFEVLRNELHFRIKSRRL